MENLFDTSLSFIRWLQETYPELEDFFVAVSATGSEQFFLAVLPFIYWSINKQAGRILGYALFISISLNTIFKQAFRMPRPFWIDPAVGIEQTPGYGLPSGHSQYAAALYLLVAAIAGSTGLWISAAALIVLQALSRIYLGAHFIQDTIAGILLGVLIVAGVILWQRRASKHFERRILGQRMLVALLVVLVVAGLYAAVLYLIGEPDMSVPWAEFIPAADTASVVEMATAIGSLLGYSIGVILEGSRIRFRSGGTAAKRIARYLVGISVTVMIWQGLGLIFPRDPLALAIPLRILRYFLVLIWVTYYAPWVFVRTGLADSDPRPEMNLRM